MADKPDVVMKRDIKRAIIEHALAGARENGFEVLGWLTGFTTDNTVYICDAVPCTRYKRQSRFSAEADPSEESELACRFPRNVGIVGLYHSHPFKFDETGEFRDIHGVSELFHSGIDDAMLRSRSSRMKNYVSIVTDIDEISCYVMHRKRQKKIKENLVGNIDFKDHMRPINSKIQLCYKESFKKGMGLASVVRALEERIISEVGRKINRDTVEIQQGPVGNVMRLLSLEKDASAQGNGKGNLFRISPVGDSMNLKVVMNITPTIFVPKGYIDMKGAAESIRNEISDYAVYLMWKDINYTEFEKHLSPAVKELEIHLGRMMAKYDDTSGMPVRVYSKPKRRMMLKKK